MWKNSHIMPLFTGTSLCFNYFDILDKRGKMYVKGINFRYLKNTQFLSLLWICTNKTKVVLISKKKCSICAKSSLNSAVTKNALQPEFALLCVYINTCIYWLCYVKGISIWPSDCWFLKPLYLFLAYTYFFTFCMKLYMFGSNNFVWKSFLFIQFPLKCIYH